VLYNEVQVIKVCLYTFKYYTLGLVTKIQACILHTILQGLDAQRDSICKWSQYGTFSGCGWRVVANILNKKLWKADKEWSSNLEVGRGPTTPPHKKVIC
jgi:hypothetical protein